MPDSEHCAFCGGYVDAMNDEAISRFRLDGTEIVWCGREHQEAWILSKEATGA